MFRLSVAGSTGAGGITSCPILAKKTNGRGGGAGELYLFFPADLVAIMLRGSCSEPGLGILELLVRIADIALLV